jgi:hypothetical protein
MEKDGTQSQSGRSGAEKSFPCWESNPDLSIILLVHSHYAGFSVAMYMRR